MPLKILGFLFILLFFANKKVEAQCDTITVPNALVSDVEYCFGMEIPLLEAVLPSGGYQVYWYDAAEEGNLIFEGWGFTPNSPGNYYAEVMELEYGCLSESRTAAEVIEFPALSYSIVEQKCEGEVYSTTFTVAGGSGTTFDINTDYIVEVMEEGLYRIGNIPSGEAPMVIIDDFHCVSQPFLMLPLNCNCEPGVVPGVESVKDSQVCFGENPMPISATSEDEALSTQWYDAPVDGNLLHIGPEFIPEEFGIYYVELVSPLGCNSDYRSIAQAVENPVILLTATERVCLADMGTYDVRLSIAGGIGFGYTIESNAGTIEQINESEIWIRNISNTETLELKAFDNLFCLSETLSLKAPPGCLPETETSNHEEEEEPLLTTSLRDSLTILAPTAFSPNGDGLNDLWQVKNNNIIEVEIIVYNRWKQVVFYSQNINNQWDGTFKGKLVEMGVYPMLVNAKFDNGRQRLQKSSITVVH